MPWLASSISPGLPPRWERVREWLVQQGREPGELTLLIHRRDHLLSQAERFALVLQASLAGAKLALLLEFANELPPLPSSLEEAAMVHGNDVEELVAKLNTVFQAK